PFREQRRSSAPDADDARVVPRNAVLVRIRRVVLGGDEVGEERVRQRLVAVRVAAGDVDCDGIVVADVLDVHVAALPVEDDDADGSLQTDEEVVLAALVVVQTADHALPRPREVHLLDRLRQPGLARELREPAAAVLVALERETVDVHLLTPVSSTRRPTSARSAQCLPPSCHQPSTRSTARRPCRAYSRLTSVISSSPRADGSSRSMMSNTSGG